LKNGVCPTGYFPVVISVLVAFSQNQSRNNYRILNKKRPKPRVLMYTGWQFLFRDVLFVTFIMQ